MVWGVVWAVCCGLRLSLPSRDTGADFHPIASFIAGRHLLSAAEKDGGNLAWFRQRVPAIYI